MSPPTRSEDQPVPLTMVPARLPLPPLLDPVLGALPARLEAYLVGGAVRDMLLGRTPRDLDLAVPRGGIRTARRVADALGADFYPLDPERDTGRVILTTPQLGRLRVDFAAFRGPDLPADLAGRDFTLNAIACDLRDGSLHDPLGGVQDLKDRLLRPCSPSSFADDPVRILRAARLAVEFQLSVVPEARALMKACVRQLGAASPERVRDELYRLLAGPRPGSGLRTLDRLGALEIILPELTPRQGRKPAAARHRPAHEHALAVVDHLDGLLALLAPEHDPERASDLASGLLVGRLGRYRAALEPHLGRALTPDRPARSLLFLAALLRSAARPPQGEGGAGTHFWDLDGAGAEMAGSRARALALSNEETTRLEAVVRHRLRAPGQAATLPSRREVYRFFRSAGEAGPDVVLVTLAEVRAAQEYGLDPAGWDGWLLLGQELLEAWFKKRAERVDPAPLVNGDELMQSLGLPPGRQVGELLEAIREAQASGDVATRAQALALAREHNDSGPAA